MVQRITVCCTGKKKRHGQINLGTLLVEVDTITELLVREGRSGLPVDDPVVAGGETYIGELVPFAMLPAAAHRQPAGDWHWPCPRCGIEKRLSGDNLRKWVDFHLSRGDTVADISQIPR